MRYDISGSFLFPSTVGAPFSCHRGVSLIASDSAAYPGRISLDDEFLVALFSFITQRMIFHE